MRTAIVLAVVVAFVVPPPVTAAQDLTAEAQQAAFKQLAEGIPLGTRVEVRTRECPSADLRAAGASVADPRICGRRLNATLVAVEADRIVVQRNSRVPEPAMAIALEDLTKLERASTGGFSTAKAVAIGLAAGVGAILTLFAIAVAIGD